MIDKNIILAKASKTDHHVRRIREKSKVSLEDFLTDLDCQESVF